ncbi:MAG: DUF3788 domain-containing protein [Victivallaceae bacterium]|nr:DUF3788 domain-containing protein [Victivallaceae bacterium]
MTGKDHITPLVPDDVQLERWLGEKRLAVWKLLRQEIEELYAIAPVWGTGGKKWLCECKYRRGGKTLCALYAGERTFGLLVIFGGAERDKFEIERQEFPDFIQTAYDAAHTYHDGKWVMFEDIEVAGVEKLMRLLHIKRRPNSKSISTVGKP